MAWFWCFLAVLIAIMATIAALAYRERALRAEHLAQLNLDSLKYWQEQACAWSEQLQELEIEMEGVQEADTEGAVIAEYVGAVPQPQNEAQMFNFASEAWLYRWLDWNPRHD